MNKDEYLTTLNPVVVADRVPIIIMHIAHQLIDCIQCSSYITEECSNTLLLYFFCRCTPLGI